MNADEMSYRASALDLLVKFMLNKLEAALKTDRSSTIFDEPGSSGCMLFEAMYEQLPINVLSLSPSTLILSSFVKS